jgi:hypothetical protein
MGLAGMLVDVSQASSSTVALTQTRRNFRGLAGSLRQQQQLRKRELHSTSQRLHCRVRREPWRVRSAAAGAEEIPAPEEEQAEFGSRDPVTAAATGSSLPTPQRIALFYDAFWRFLRPHTIRGTFLGTTALVTRALLENPTLINWALLPKALRGLLALLCGNGFIVGINQIYDYGIDKVNKPFLPIAAGDLSVPAAWALVVGLAALGIGIVATNFGMLITALYTLGLFLGTVYSVPPLRLKQYPVPAFVIIATVRGFLLNFGVYYATRAALTSKEIRGSTSPHSPPTLVSARFRSWAPGSCLRITSVPLWLRSICLTRSRPRSWSLGTLFWASLSFTRLGC